jgi:hypothetical protein
MEDVGEDMNSECNEPQKVVIYEPPRLPKAYKQSKPEKGMKDDFLIKFRTTEID